MNKVRLLLKSISDNGIKMTSQKIFIKKYGRVILDAQRKNNFLEQKNLISAIDITPEDLTKNLELVSNSENASSEVKTINWFLPNFNHVLYGGIYTILRFAAFFQEKGIHNRIIIFDNPFADISILRKTVIKEFPQLSEADFLAHNGNIEDLPECDATISTFWTSCYLSVKFNKTKKKFYFIQDYEPLFYSANSYYALAEATYRFGFKGLVNTPGLADFVRAQHGMVCQEFYPCVDLSVYNVEDSQLRDKLAKKDDINIFLYGRPNHDRNAFELAVIALKKLKEKYRERINIYSAGDNWKEEDFGVQGVIKNLGRLDSIEKVADLYRKSDIGLVFMFTKHPSYQPFEYMACGCAVVTNYNNSNTWYLKDKENALLSEPTPSFVVEKISNLIEDNKLSEKIVNNGLSEVRRRSWNDECEKIYKYINI